MSKRRLTIAVFNEREGGVLPDRYVDRIGSAAGDGVEVRRVASRAELLEALPETNYLVGFQVSEEQLADRCAPLEWVQLTGSGDAPGAVRAAFERGVRVTTAVRIRAPQVAEHAVALTLALVRGLHLSMQAQAEHRWASEEVGRRVRTLTGAVVGVIAAGGQGEEIARRLKSFGATTLATRRDPQNPFLHVDEMLPLGAINDLMARSDVVIVATPRSPGLEALVARKQLAAMRPETYLVDVSRGGVVDEAALIEALRKGRIAGAALDVFETEPLPTNSPLWTMANVLVTPHVAAASPAYWDRATQLICDNVARLASGEPLIDELSADWFGVAAKH